MRARMSTLIMCQFHRPSLPDSFALSLHPATTWLVFLPTHGDAPTTRLRRTPGGRAAAGDGRPPISFVRPMPEKKTLEFSTGSQMRPLEECAFDVGRSKGSGYVVSVSQPPIGSRDQPCRSGSAVVPPDTPKLKSIRQRQEKGRPAHRPADDRGACTRQCIDHPTIHPHQAAQGRPERRPIWQPTDQGGTVASWTG